MKKRGAPILLAALVAVAIPASMLVVPQRVGRACDSDAACKGGRKCVSSVCAPPPSASASAGATCKDDIDCSGDLVCEKGNCKDLAAVVPSAATSSSVTTATSGAMSDICGMVDLPSGSFPIGTASDEEEKFITKIAKSIGVLNVPRVQQAPGIQNAIATMYGGHRLIVFDPAFLTALRGTGPERWSDMAVLAHELGHHLNGHTVEAPGLACSSQQQRELEADYYSGYALAMYGANKTEATSAIDGMAALIGDNGASCSHPAPAERRVKVLDGWSDAHSVKVTAEDKTAPSTLTVPPTPPPTVAMPPPPPMPPPTSAPIPGRFCGTPAGACPMSFWAAVGEPCYCPTFYGPIWGQIVP
jgi:hypothetical protein